MFIRDSARGVEGNVERSSILELTFGHVQCDCLWDEEEIQTRKTPQGSGLSS